MSNNKILLAVFCLFALLGAGFFSFFLLTKIGDVKAGTDQNVSGWAWSENIGWVSFNSTNCDSDENGITDTGNYPQCPDGAVSADYGVNINPADGSFSGYAWSESIGWIDFAPDGPYPKPPNYSAKVNDDGKVSGWARALSYTGGWDGWIKLDGVSIDIVNRDFSGYAWGSDVIGWLSFAGSNYNVATTFDFNRAPSAEDLEANQGDYCTPPPHLTLNWNFIDLDGDKQYGYQVQIDDDKEMSSPLNDSCPTAETGTCDLDPPHDSQSYAPIISLLYDTTYYWRVKVADEHASWSDWSEVVSFATPVHEFPEPDFTTIAQKITKNEFVQFCAVQEGGLCEEDNSVCYDADGSIPPPSCHDKTFVWDFPEGTEFAEDSAADSENPMVKFTSGGAMDVSLNITDDIGSCTITKAISITKPLPRWKEIAP